LAGTLGEISFRQLVNAKICLLFFGREEIDLVVDYGARVKIVYLE